VCFLVRLAGLHFDLDVPEAPSGWLRRSD
jgi:hypothetical protein